MHDHHVTDCDRVINESIANKSILVMTVDNCYVSLTSDLHITCDSLTRWLKHKDFPLEMLLVLFSLRRTSFFKFVKITK